jgi:hypothetical protein
LLNYYDDEEFTSQDIRVDFEMVLMKLALAKIDGEVTIKLDDYVFVGEYKRRKKWQFFFNFVDFYIAQNLKGFILKHSQEPTKSYR